MTSFNSISRNARRLAIGWRWRAGVVLGTPIPAEYEGELADTMKAVRRYTLTTHARIAALVDAVTYVVDEGIEGDLVECGGLKGGSMMAAAMTLSRLGVTDRDLYLFDTFAGMPEPTEEDVSSPPYDGYSLHKRWSRHDKSGTEWVGVPVETVRANVESTGYPAERIKTLVGMVEDTIPSEAPARIALLRLDTDWYASTKHELVELFPRLAVGGVLIVDDYGHYEGARKAVDEYFVETGQRILLSRIDYTGRIAVKQGAGRNRMSERSDPVLISVTAPVFNEEEILETFYGRIRAALEDHDWELVLVNDGSTDSTPAILDQLSASDERVKVVHLARNFGYQPAVIAGLDHCQGDVVITIDADLQDPPELIGEMLDSWRQGSDVVYAVRRERVGESRLKLLTARWFSSIFSRLAEMDIPTNAGDFRLLDRRAVDALLRMRERSRFMRGMSVWVGFTQTTVPYDRDARFAGETRYRWRSLLKIALDGISSFSHVPLQIATLVGFAVSFIAFLGIPYVIVSRIFNLYVEGLSTILFAILFLGGIQLITLGIIGEYVSRVYDEVKRRPIYLIGERRNLDGPYPGLAEFDPPTHREIGPASSDDD